MTDCKAMIIHATADGITRGVSVWLINEFIFSLFSGKSIETILLRTALLCIAALAILSWLTRRSLKKMGRCKMRTIYYFFSLLMFLISLLCMLALIITFHINLFPEKAVGNVDGILLLFIDAAFVFISGMIRICLAICTLGQ